MASRRQSSAKGEDSNLICHQCGLTITRLDSVIQVNGENNNGNKNNKNATQLFHRECFRCYACKRQLVKDCYFLSQERNLYCPVHHDFEYPNGHDRFVKELPKFRAKSLDSIAILSEKTTKLSKTKLYPLSTQHSVDCTSSSLILNCDGFWTECLSYDCPVENYPKHRFNLTCGELLKFNSYLEHHEEEIYESCFYSYQHYNYYCQDQMVGPVLLSIRQELLCNREYYRILVRSSSIITEGLVPSSCFLVSNKYDREEVVSILARELKFTESFNQTVNPSTPMQLCQLDRVLLKNHFKVGVLFVDEGQESEKEYFQNSQHTSQFDDFLAYLGDRIDLKDFTKFNGGLDTTYDLTGKVSIFTEWRGNQIMFHVSTLLPYDNGSKDAQTLQRKRHIGNDIVCIVYLATSNCNFKPDSVTSSFIHVFIVVRPVIDNNQLFEISIISRDQVQPFLPPLLSNQFSLLNTEYRDWLLSKIINGERASYRSPKFATMQQRSRKQLMMELIRDEMSSLPVAVKREKQSSSPKMAFSNEAIALDWHQETFEDLKGLKKDFHEAFNMELDEFHDICFIVGGNEQNGIPAVKPILAARSRVFANLINGSPTCTSQGQQFSFQGFQKPMPAAKAKKSPHQPPKIRKRISIDRLLRRGQFEKDNENNNRDKLLHFPHDRQELMIPQFDANELSLLLEYLHTGSCVLYAEVLPALLAAAEFFEIDDLVSLCLAATSDVISPCKACPMLVAVRGFTARYKMADTLQRLIMDYIRGNIVLVYENFDMASLPEDCLILILSLDVTIDEMLKFKLICHWIDRNTFSGSSGVAEILKDALLSFVKLNNFTTKDLKECVGPSGLFAQKAITDILNKKQRLKRL